MTNRLILAIADTTFVFGLVVFIYVSVVGIVHPEWLDDPITHPGWLGFIRTDNLGLLSFVASVLGFLIAWYMKSR